MFDPIQTGQGQASAEIMVLPEVQLQRTKQTKRPRNERRRAAHRAAQRGTQHPPRHCLHCRRVSPLRSTSTTSSPSFLEEQATQVAIARSGLSLETDESPCSRTKSTERKNARCWYAHESSSGSVLLLEIPVHA